MGLELKFRNVNEEKYNQEVKFLQDQIINGTHTDYFLAMNHEAGFGKTIYAERALIEAANSGKRSIFCRQLVEECNISANRINAEAGREIAIAIDHDNFKAYEKNIKKYPIVIITHQKYIWLSKDIEQQSKFKNGRDILIIDEEINMIKPIDFRAKNHSAFVGMLNNFTSIRDLYLEITEEIYNFISVNTQKIFYKPTNDMKEKIKKLKILIKANIDYRYADLFDLKVGYFLEKIDELEIFLNNVSVADGKVLYNYDKNIKFWKLKNNIILDACADVNYIYKISSEFKIAQQEKVFDHSKWTINVINHNSCRTKKQKSKNFYTEVNNSIHSLTNEDDKMLVIGSKNEINKIKINERISFIWFGNFVGKNDWLRYTKCYIILNPQWNFPDYVLSYMYYSGASFNIGDKWDAGTNNDGVYRFRNNEIELIRQTSIASSIYQGIKRINRDNSENAEVYIINNDQEILNMIIKEFQNIKVDNHSLDIKYEESQKKQDYDKKRGDESYYTKFIEVVNGLEKGVYQKKWIREQIGLSNGKVFSQKVLNKQKVIDHMAHSNIVPKGQSIIIS